MSIFGVDDVHNFSIEAGGYASHMPHNAEVDTSCHEIGVPRKSVAVCATNVFFWEKPQSFPMAAWQFLRRYRFPVGIVVAVLVSAASAAWIWVVPEIKFQNAMTEGRQAERAMEWDRALDAYARADFLREGDKSVDAAIRRVLAKRDLHLYSQAMGRGRQAEGSKNWASALAEYDRALLRKPEDSEARASVARVNYQIQMQSGRDYEKTQSWDAAQISYSRALSDRPRDEEASLALRRIAQLEAELCAAQRQTTQRDSLPVSAQLPKHQLREPQKPKDLVVDLQWKKLDLPAIPTEAKQTVPSKSEEIKPWIIRHILGNAGDETISVASIPQTDPNAWWCSKQYEELSEDAKTFNGRLYRAVGEHLLTAEHLLRSQDAPQRHLGIGMAVQAVRCALFKLNDTNLAVAVADLYILQNLDAADGPEWEWLSKPRVIEQAARAFAKAEDDLRLTAAYQLLLQYGSKNVADSARLSLAQLYLKQGDKERALKYLGEIDPNGGMAGAKKMISAIQDDSGEKKTAREKSLLRRLFP